MNFVRKIWHQLFLIERPSISLSFVRMIMAMTTIFYIVPTLVNLPDNYFPTAFKTLNSDLLPQGLVLTAQKSPIWLIICFVWVFYISSFFFLIGLCSRLSCIVMVLSCYYFQALNNFHIGSALSWDILLVTLFFFCLVPYHGDYFSVDALLSGDLSAYKRRRPYFVQRLLQLHLGFMYFYTALYKITARGNWLTDNPLYYVLNYPQAGVTKNFLLRDFLMDKPALCYWLGISMVSLELSMIFFLFWRKTRVSAIYLCTIFHITLLLTMDVPAILFFVFTGLSLLFIDPDRVVRWIERRRLYNNRAGGLVLVYDGDCGFCRKCLRIIQTADLYGLIRPVNFRTEPDLARLHPELTHERAEKSFFFIDADGQLSGGYAAFRAMASKLPMFCGLLPLLYFPGMGMLGPILYKFVSQNRPFFNKLLPNALLRLES